MIARRYLARLIDSIVLFALVVTETLLCTVLGVSVRSAFGSLFLFGLALVTFMSYGGLLESSPWQATIGKKILAMRVYGPGGGRLTFSQALVRNLIKDGPFLVVSVLPYGQLLGLAWLGAHLVVIHRSPVYQAIHDRIAGSLVAAPEQTIQLNLSV